MLEIRFIDASNLSILVTIVWCHLITTTKKPDVKVSFFNWKTFHCHSKYFLRNRKRIEKFKLYWRISDSAVWLEELNASVTMNYFYTPIQHTVICNTSFWINCVIFFGGYQFELIVYQKWFWVSRSDKFSIVILGENLYYSFNIMVSLTHCYCCNSIKRYSYVLR